LPKYSPSYAPAPSLRVVPKSAKDWKLGELAVSLASGYGLTADDWQADPVHCILARRKSGRWAAATTKITVPRQNGKNGILEIVELFGMVVLGLKFLHTAHEVKTARKAFRRIVSFFENERQYPELHRLAKEIRKTNGQEALVLHAADCDEMGHGNAACGCDGGGSVEFIARSSGSGRGFTVDVLVCDEDQDLTDDELAALLPTISAAPSKNPMVIMTGTPPDPDKMDAAKGEVARRVRAEAQAGTDPYLCCFDWGVPDGPMPDVDNEAIAYDTNPALVSGRLSIEEVRREKKMMSAAKFARERYGWWGDPETKHQGVLSVKQWGDLKVVAPEPTKAQLVVDVSPNLEWTSVGLASQAPDGRTLVMVKREPGTGWADKSVIRTVKGAPDLPPVEITEVALTPNAMIFAPALTAAGIEHHPLTNTEIGRGCTAFQEWVRDGSVVHLGQQELDAAVRNARTRYVGDTQHWDQRDRAIDNTPLVATSVAAQRWRLSPPPRSAYEDHDLLVL
jgi:hypothetical protein